jgi:magnesium transporter
MRIIAWQEGKWQQLETPTHEEARQLALGPIPVWVRAEGVAMEAWDNLGAWFDLHPLALEDIRNPRQRPKVEDYPGFTFLVARLPRFANEDVAWVQVGVFLGEGVGMTTTLDPVPELDEAERRLLAGSARAGAGELDVVFYHVLDVIADAWFPFMDILEDRLEDLENAVLEAPSKQNLQRIRDMKDLVSRTRKVLQPMRDASLNLERGNHPNIRNDTRIFLRDVADHTIRLAERLEHVKEMALIAQETWNSTLATQQNESMKRLTVIAALLLVPTLIAGIGGMNFEDGFPEWGFWPVTLSILAVVAAGLVLAMWRRWI